MHYRIETSIEIAASSSRVWEILMDFDKYPAWNPFIQRIRGDRELGGKLEADIQGMKFKPLVTAYRKDVLFTWKGRLLMKGLFDGEHSFRLESIGANRCRFHHSENFDGILVWFFRGLLEKKTKPGFLAMNEALKKRVEG